MVASRNDAKLLGERYYDTGKPCKHGHLSKRFTHNGNCYQCTQLASNKNFHSKKLDIDKRKIQILKKVEQRARIRGIEFNLTVDTVVWPTVCPVFGYVLSYDKADKDRSVSLDRNDPTKGYTVDNTVIMSARANRAKWDMSSSEVKQLYEYILSRPQP